MVLAGDRLSPHRRSPGAGEPCQRGCGQQCDVIELMVTANSRRRSQRLDEIAKRAQANNKNPARRLPPPRRPEPWSAPRQKIEIDVVGEPFECGKNGGMRFAIRRSDACHQIFDDLLSGCDRRAIGVIGAVIARNQQTLSAASDDDRLQRQMGDRRLTADMIAPKAGDQAVNVASDPVTAVAAACLLVPGEEVIEGCPGWKIARAQQQTTHPGAPRQRTRIRRSRYAPCRPIARSASRKRRPAIAHHP